MFHSFPRPGLHSTRGALRNAGCGLEGYLRLDAKQCQPLFSLAQPFYGWVSDRSN